MVSTGAGPASEQPRCTWCVPFWRGWGAMPDEVKGPADEKAAAPHLRTRPSRSSRCAEPSGKEPAEFGNQTG